MLDLYFRGKTFEEIARKVGRGPKDVSCKLRQFAYNEEGKAVRYKPYRRMSRAGKRMTKNELAMVRNYRKHGLPLDALAKVLCRPSKDLSPDKESSMMVNDVSRLGAGVDLVLAHRYLYYVKAMPVISDFAYDQIEKEEMEFGKNAQVLKSVGSDREEDYPPHVRALAMYLLFKYSVRKGTR